MSRFTHLFICVLILAVPTDSFAQIAFDPPAFEGRMAPNDKSVEVRFKVKNIGETPCLIKKVKAACVCTRVDLENKILMPGQSVDVGTTLTPKVVNEAYRTTLAFITDNPTTPSYVYSISISSTAGPSLRFRPNYLILDGMRPGETKETRIEVFYLSGALEGKIPVLDSLSVETDIAGLTLKEISKGRNYFVYEAFYRAPNQQVSKDASIRFFSNRPRMSVDLPVWLHNDGSIILDSNRIFWGFLESAKGFPAKREISIRFESPKFRGDIIFDYDKNILSVIEKKPLENDEALYEIVLKKPPVREGKFSTVLRISLMDGKDVYGIENVGYVVR